MNRERSKSREKSPFVVIFTDLDGTLLDHDTYRWDEAQPALLLCKRLGVPIVLVSSKTGAEIKVLQRHLGISAPFISENGGGIFFPKSVHQEPPSGATASENGWRWPLGASYDLLTDALKEIRKELGWDMRGFSEMSTEEIVQLTGLDLAASRLAAMREYDEPFIVVESEKIDIARLSEAVKKRGLNMTMGGRFYHIHGKIKKGEAVKRLISWYGEQHALVVSVGLGDSPNDFSMLNCVDYPVLIRSTRRFPGIEKDIPHLQITEEVGPKGWNRAVLGILDEKFKGGIF